MKKNEFLRIVGQILYFLVEQKGKPATTHINPVNEKKNWKS